MGLRCLEVVKCLAHKHDRIATAMTNEAEVLLRGCDPERCITGCKLAETLSVPTVDAASTHALVLAVLQQQGQNLWVSRAALRALATLARSDKERESSVRATITAIRQHSGNAFLLEEACGVLAQCPVNGLRTERADAILAALQ